ncbi:CopG family transcriptional regulator, partial [Jiangella rhizosphaerae]
MDDALDRELRALGRSLTSAIDDDAPAPAAVATAVLDRLPTAPEPAPARWTPVRRRLA